jgi:2-hydroxychromene-2-carboxylate isomerase
MKHLVFDFDVISPYAYLAFERLPQALEGLSYEVTYRPLLFARLLEHWGQKGPAEIAPKREWTYRQVAWLGHRHGIELHMPEKHPFNPLGLLRLAWACSQAGGTPNRRVCEAVLRHVWRGGLAADDAARLAALERELAPALDPRSDAVKARLREATAQAAAEGVFGVPTIRVDGRAFWGFDALDMLGGYLRGDAWFDGPAWDQAAATPVGVQRR